MLRAFTRLAATVLALSVALPAIAVPEWGQCGGIGYTGSTTCDAGLVCHVWSDYYYQCVSPDIAGSSAPPPPTSTRVTTSSPPSSPSSTVTSSRTRSVFSPTTTSAGPSTSTCPIIASGYSPPTNSKLPDPFTPISGPRISTKDAWKCRRDEICQLMQRFELGTKPPKPSSVTASFASNTLTINVSDSGKSISFTAGITYPSGSGPFPAIIAFGGGSIPRNPNVAVINFNNDDIAAQVDGSSRGKGKFYTLYGSSHSAGAMMAWAWGVSRIIDALEVTPAAKIDVTRIGVTGCSRNGKGAFVAGAFDERIALTIPQESGSGGSACWRLSDAQRNAGQNVQTASEIVGENVWFSTAFNAFSTSVNRLPFDHHSLAGLVAPRGLFVIENTSMEWLGNLSCYGCMIAGRLIYQALGVTSNMGFSQVGNHNHCAFPSSQQSELDAFINRFLLGQSTNTNVFRTDGNLNFNQAQWVDWTVPTLQ
ncbi:carbohydrate-binding module 1 [Tulasnella sp. 403]|nr:carbohydrate-binding module 1 [Tulasnella sp. 403]